MEEIRLDVVNEKRDLIYLFTVTMKLPQATQEAYTALLSSIFIYALLLTPKGLTQQVMTER